MIVAWITLAVLGAWLVGGAYHALLSPPRIGKLSEAQTLGVLLGLMLGGVACIVVAGVAVVS